MTTLKAPCKACPWRKNSAAGWLGASTPVEFLQQSEAETQMPCHLHVDYDSDDWRQQADKAPQCAGRAVHFANRCKRPRNPDLITLPSNYQEVFSNPQEFITHHTMPSEPVPQIQILGSEIRVVGTVPSEKTSKPRAEAIAT